MSSLLDCYGSISEQISKINLDPLSSYSHIQDEQKYYRSKFQAMLTVLADKLDPRKTLHIQYLFKGCSTEGKQKQGQSLDCEISFIYDTIYMGFDILTSIRICSSSFQILIKNSVLKNGIPLRVENKHARLSINKYLTRINSVLKHGHLNLDLVNGNLFFILGSLLSVCQFEAFIFEPLRLVQLLQEQLLKSKHYIRMHLYKILYLTNQPLLGQNYAEDPSLSKHQIKGLNSFYRQTCQLTEKILPFVHLQFPFMYSDHTCSGIKNISPDLIKKMNEMIRTLKYNSRCLTNDVLKILKVMEVTEGEQESSILYKTNAQMSFSDEEKRDLINILLPPFVRHQSGEPPYVYSQIEIKNEPQWDQIDKGGFGQIKKASVDFVYVKDIEKCHPRMNNPFRRVLVRKDDHRENMKHTSKLNHEKDILAHLKNSISPFVAKYFFSKQPPYQSSMFIEYCPQKSFANYRNKNLNFMTLGTKLIYLKYVAQGMKFLKDHKICHLDLKPSNILFGSGHIKIIDFGEAYHPENCEKNFRPGTSLPYAPPQAFSQDLINFSDRLDIFSFGVMMHEILYEGYPVDYSKENYNFLKKAYCEKTYQQLIVTLPEKIEGCGYRKIYQHLTYVILKCLQKQEKKRPCIEWIIIILQCCISLEQHLFFW